MLLPYMQIPKKLCTLLKLQALLHLIVRINGERKAQRQTKRMTHRQLMIKEKKALRQVFMSARITDTHKNYGVNTKNDFNFKLFDFKQKFHATKYE